MCHTVIYDDLIEHECRDDDRFFYRRLLLGTERVMSRRRGGQHDRCVVDGDLVELSAKSRYLIVSRSKHGADDAPEGIDAHYQ
jgi:hypothetical protein